MIVIRDIIERYDPDTDGEIKAVTKVGKDIAKRLREHEWMHWTKFPEGFGNCRTDADLLQMIDNYNKWLTITGLGGTEDDDDELLLLDDDDELLLEGDY